MAEQGLVRVVAQTAGAPVTSDREEGFAEAARQQVHYRPLAACALDYAIAGVTSIEEVLKVCATLADDEVIA